MAEINLHNIDCMEWMADKPDNHYDLAIVDPPYGIDAGNMTMGRGSGNDTGKHKAKNWDKNIPNEMYFNELKRVSKNQIIWGGNYFLDYLGYCKGVIIWDKKDYNSDFADGELAWSSCDRNLKIFQRARSTGGDSKNKIHPTQKPAELYRWILERYSKKGDKILDTHGGSMSIAIACHDMGFDLDLCELDKDYFEAGKKRYENHISQIRMF